MHAEPQSQCVKTCVVTRFCDGRRAEEPALYPPPEYQVPGTAALRIDLFYSPLSIASHRKSLFFSYDRRGCDVMQLTIAMQFKDEFQLCSRRDCFFLR